MNGLLEYLPERSPKRPASILLLLLALASLGALFFLSGCGASHGSEADAAMAASDGGPVTMARDASSSAQDAASAADASAAIDGSSPLPFSCTTSASTVLGAEPCFCRGPIIHHGFYLYRLGYELEVYEISDPARPRLVTTVADVLASTGSFAVARGHLYFGSDSDEEVRVFSLADPIHPVEVDPGEHGIGPGDLLVAATEERLVTAAVSTGGDHPTTVIRIHDLSDPAHPMVLGDPQILEGAAHAVEIAAGRAFVLHGDGPGSDRLSAFDTAAGAEAVGSLAIEGGWYARGLAVQGDLAYLGGYGEHLLQIIDIGDPGRMAIRATVAAPAEAPSASGHTVRTRGDLVVVGGGPLVFLDVGDPDRPRIAGWSEPTNDFFGLAIVGDHVLASGGSGLWSLPIDCD